jgi:hypothetical protein
MVYKEVANDNRVGSIVLFKSLNISKTLQPFDNLCVYICWSCVGVWSSLLWLCQDFVFSRFHVNYYVAI